MPRMEKVMTAVGPILSAKTGRYSKVASASCSLRLGMKVMASTCSAVRMSPGRTARSPSISFPRGSAVTQMPRSSSSGDSSPEENS